MNWSKKKEGGKDRWGAIFLLVALGYFGLLVAADFDGDGVVDSWQQKFGLSTNVLVSPPGIVGWWQANNGSTNFTDRTPNLLTGVASNFTPNAQGPWPGLYGNSVLLSGVSSNPVVRFPTTGILNKGLSNGFTISLWLNSSNTTKKINLARFYSKAGNVTNTFSLYLHTNGVASLALSSGTSNITVRGGTTAQNNFDAQWHHVAATFDKVTTQSVVYVDGVIEKSTKTPLPNFGLTNGVTFDIGAYPYNTAQPPIFIDEIRLYQRPLNQTEIQQLPSTYYDLDGDGLNSLQEAALGTNPFAADTDGDGIPDDLDLSPIDTITVVSGNFQTGNTNTFLPQPFVIQINQGGVIQTNKSISIVALPGGGKVSKTLGGTISTNITVVTGPDGRATAWFKTPSTFSSTNKSQAIVGFGNATNKVTFTSFNTDSRVPYSNLKLWLKADNGVATNSSGNVVQWLDQSGNQNHAVTSSNAVSPKLAFNVVNSQPALTFDGVNDLMTLPAGFDNFTTGMTVIAVVKPTAAGVRAGVLDLGNGGSMDNIILGSTSTNFSINFAIYAGSSKKGLDANTVVNTNGFQSMGVVFDGNTTKATRIYRNGDLQKSGTTTNITQILRSNNRIGKTSFSSDVFFKGNIAELLLYGRPLSSAEFANVSDYLNLKYGLITPTAKMPIISPNGGIISGANITVTISSATAGADIRYTINGGDPTQSSLPYTNPIVLSTNSLLKARAFFQGYTPSSISYANFEKSLISPNNYTNLVLWLRADAGIERDGNGLFTRWSDMSGNGNHATATNSLTAPIWSTNSTNGLPAFTFNGTNQFLKLPSGFSNFTNGFTALVVARPKGSGFRSDFIDLGGGSKNGNILFGHTGNNLIYANYVGTKSNQVEAVSVASSNNWRVFSVSHDLASQNLKLFTNGIAQSTTSIQLTITNFVRTQNQIGKGSYTGDSFLHGDISEIIVFNRNLSDDEMKNASDYLGIKYNIYKPTLQICDIMPGSGGLFPGEKVKITNTNPSSQIYYTTNGATPTTSSQLYTEPFAVTPPVTVKAKAFQNGYTASSIKTVNYTVPTQVPAPTITPGDGQYTSAPLVSLECRIPTATIYYTTDGSDPNPITSLPYTAPILAPLPGEINAIAVLNGYQNSEIAYAYFERPQVADVIIMPTGYSFTSKPTVTMSCSTLGAKIYYTTDGTQPDETSTLYTEPFVTDLPVSIQAIGILQDYDDSYITYTDYVWKYTASKPVISPASGLKPLNVPISMTSTNVGAKIYYTTDGTSPNTTSYLFTTNIYLLSPVTLKAISILPNYNPSAEATANYQADFTLPSPTITPISGLYTNSVSVTMTSTIPNSKIYYTKRSYVTSFPWDPDTNSYLYTGPFTASLPMTINAKTIMPGSNSSAIVAVTYDRPVTENITISTPPGYYASSPISATMSCPTPGAIIYFTTNSTVNATNIYSSSINIKLPGYLYAYAQRPGYKSSAGVECRYFWTNTAVVSTPGISPRNNYITNGQLISLSCATANSTIYFTTNGSIPNKNSTKYLNAFQVSPPLTINAIAYATGKGDSVVSTMNYESMVDIDSDGLPDAWEIKYFGDLSASPTGDENQNGIPNSEEYANDLDPKKSLTVFDWSVDSIQRGQVKTKNINVSNIPLLVNYKYIDNGLRNESTGKYIIGEDWALNPKVFPRDAPLPSPEFITQNTTLGVYNDGDPSPAALKFSLHPIVLKVVDRDDPRNKWGSEKVQSLSKPIFSGESCGDMVSWKLIGTDGWTNTTFTWTAQGPGGEIVVGPTGSGKNEWTINDNDEDITNDWLKWKPGKWKIKVQVGTTQAEFEQNVGVRTDDVVVVGWIDPQQVSLNSSGVQSGLIEVLPPSGLSASDGDNAKLKAAMLLKHISEVGVSSDFQIDAGPLMIGVDFTPFSAADKTYTLNWMFKYAGNPAPPDDFTDNDGYFSQQELDDFTTKLNATHYKLLNHYQARYLVGEDKKFKSGTLVNIKSKAAIGNTKDPSRLYEISGLIDWIISYIAINFQGYPADGIFPGMPRENNSDTPVINDTISKLCNEGTPDQRALDAFKNLTGHDQGYIWSSITFFSDLQYYSETISPSTIQSLTRNPKPTKYYQGRINTQVYPTYWIYINGVKKGVQNQAPNPSALFPNTDKCQ